MKCLEKFHFFIDFLVTENTSLAQGQVAPKSHVMPLITLNIYLILYHLR